MTARDNTAPLLPKRVPARIPEAELAYRLPPAADGTRHDYTELAHNDIPPPPVVSLEVKMALATLALKARVWKSRGQGHDLDRYLDARNPGHANKIGNLKQNREYNDEVCDTAHLLNEDALSGRPLRLDYGDEVRAAAAAVNQDAMTRHERWKAQAAAESERWAGTQAAGHQQDDQAAAGRHARYRAEAGRRWP